MAGMDSCDSCEVTGRVKRTYQMFVFYMYRSTCQTDLRIRLGMLMLPQTLMLLLLACDRV